MKRQMIVLATVLCTLVSSTASAQIDIGITNLTVLDPSDLNANNELKEGDTITQVQFEIFNFSAQSISGADFPNGEIKISASYNGDFKITNNPLMGSINSQDGRLAKFPEDFNPYQPLPDFPAGKGEVELCIYTQYSNDDDISNDTACIVFNVVEEIGAVGVDQVNESDDEILLKQVSNQLIIESETAISISGITDLTGRTIDVSSSELKHNHTISLEGFSPGIYVFHYIGKNNIVHHKRFWAN